MAPDPRAEPIESRHRITPGDEFVIARHDTSDTGELHDEEQGVEELRRLRERISDLQGPLLAEGKRALLVVLQGFDGSGKDTVITHVMSAFDPAGCRVYAFKKPTAEETAHDFLWRFHQQTPALGMCHVFDRSYYEEVVAARVHGEIEESVWRSRYESINDFERMLVREGTIVLKFFLHVSKDAQADRVRERSRSVRSAPTSRRLTSRSANTGRLTTAPTRTQSRPRAKSGRLGTRCPPTTSGTSGPRPLR